MTETGLIYNKTVVFGYIYSVNSIVFWTARYLSPSYARLIQYKPSDKIQCILISATHI